MRRYVTCTLTFVSLTILWTVFASQAQAATTIHVPADQPTIQDAINAASNGDTVLVSPGTYYENINFTGKAIILTSASGASSTIIDGRQLGPVVTFSSQETRSSVLTGFTIRNGNGADFLGGGVNITNASPTINKNVITLSSSCDAGSGLSINGGGPLVQNNMIIANNYGTACGAYSAVSVNGAGATEVIGNVILGNNFGGLWITASSGSVSIISNSIMFNYGPGASIYPSGANVSLVQNLITGNQDYGLSIAPPISIVNNTIVNNSVTGGVYDASEITATVMNNQVVMDNNLVISIGSNPALYCFSYDSGNPPVFNNNDLFALDAEAYYACPDATGTSGNISADPAFVDILSDNFHLQSTSPAIDAGDNSAQGLPKADLDGDSRVIHNTVDMGIDEYSAHTGLSLSSYSLYYSAQQSGTGSASQTVTLTNNKGVAAKLNWIDAAYDFSQTNNCPASLPAGASCQISVSFSPVAGGTRNGALAIFTSATANPLTVGLTGTGLVPSISLSTNYLSFYGQVIGTTASQSETVTNNGQAPLTISGFTLSQPGNDFSQSSDCPIAPRTLGVGASCTLTVTWTPNVVGNETGQLTVSSNATYNPIVYAYGTSYSAGVVSLSPTSLIFPTTTIGSSSDPQTVTLTNTGTGTLGNISTYSFGDFPDTTNCPTSLVPGASCTINVVFTPSYNNFENATVNVYGDTQFTSFIQVSGTGMAPVPTISSLSMANVFAGSAELGVTANGTGFYAGSQILVNGIAVNASASGQTQMNFIIPAANLVNPAVLQVSVFNPSPGGGTSNSVPFTVYPPVSYTFRSASYEYRNITGTNLNLYYYGQAPITPPFAIQFAGGSYSTMTVSGGGTISFSGFYSPYNDIIPTNQTPQLIAPFWAQLDPSGNKNVYWQVLGTAPNRQLVIEWRNVGICCETSNTVRFEVVFFEGNSNILFNYADTVFGGSYSSNDNGATATVGVQVAPNIGTQFSYDQPSLASQTSVLWYPNNPTATLSTSAISFGYHQIGTSALAQALTVTNGGEAALAISSIAADNPDFTESNNCGTTVPPHQSCSIHVVFKPTQPTTETAMLTITDNATSSPQTVSLTGIGTVTGIVVYPVLVNFGGVTTNTTGTAPVTLANATNQALSIQGITAVPAVYTASNNCGSSLAAGQACTIAVNFTPTQKGSIQGTLSMALNGKASAVKAKLTGSGQ